MQSYNLPFAATAKAYLQTLLALPAMKQWYQEALAETWTDEAHDVEIAGYGTITADLRLPG